MHASRSLLRSQRFFKLKKICHRPVVGDDVPLTQVQPLPAAVPEPLPLEPRRKPALRRPRQPEQDDAEDDESTVDVTMHMRPARDAEVTLLMALFGATAAALYQVFLFLFCAGAS